MAFVEEVPTPGNDPRQELINPVTGMVSVAGTPIQATEEQNQRVRMILDALGSGVSPMSQGVPHSAELTPVPTPGAPAGAPFALSGYQEQPGQSTPPSDNRNRLLEALRTRPQETIQAMSQLSQQLKGVPEFAQKQVYQGLGMGEPATPPLTDMSVQAAAAGMRIPGLDPNMAKRILQQKLGMEGLQAQQRAQIQREEAALRPLTPQQTASLYKYDEKLNRAMPYQGTKPITAAEAQAQGYRSVNPKVISDAQQSNDAVNLQFTLLKGALEAAKPKSYYELAASNASGGRIGGIEGANLFSAIRDFAFQWDRLIGGVRAASSPGFLAAMTARLPSLWDDAKTRAQRTQLLAPAVRALQREKLAAVMGLPPDPRVKQELEAALKGMGLPPRLVRQFVYESGEVPDAQVPQELPVAPRSDNVIEWQGKRLVREGPGRYRLAEEGE